MTSVRREGQSLRRNGHGVLVNLLWNSTVLRIYKNPLLSEGEKGESTSPPAMDSLQKGSWLKVMALFVVFQQAM